MTTSTAAVILSSNSRPRIRCAILRNHLEPYREKLLERGIQLSEGIEMDKLCGVLNGHGAEPAYGFNLSIPCTQEICVSFGPDGVLHHRRLIEAVERGFKRVQMNISSLAEECDSLKASLVEQIGSIGRQVEPEYFHWILAILATGTLRNAANALGIPKSSLDRKLKEYATRGGVYTALDSLVRFRQRKLGRHRLVSYQDDFLRMASSGDASGQNNILEEVLDALEAQNEHNWPRVRDEILELLRDYQ